MKNEKKNKKLAPTADVAVALPLTSQIHCSEKLTLSSPRLPPLLPGRGCRGRHCCRWIHGGGGWIWLRPTSPAPNPARRRGAEGGGRWWPAVLERERAVGGSPRGGGRRPLGKGHAAVTSSHQRSGGRPDPAAPKPPRSRVELTLPEGPAHRCRGPLAARLISRRWILGQLASPSSGWKEGHAVAN